MDLKSYDGKCVRITASSGEVFEGVVSYCGREYVFHEYGWDQEALLLVPILFYADDISKIESLEDVHGPFGHYSEKYGLLEKQCLEWGPDMIGEIFDTEDDIGILRMLACINDNFKALMNRTAPGMDSCSADIANMLEALIKHNKNEEAVKEAKALLERIDNAAGTNG